MKKRFLIIGDNHLDSKTPQSRLDNYMLAGLSELEETLKIARAAQVDYYILLGDVFHRIDVGGECRNRALEILSKDESGKSWGFEKYLVVGNHDIAHDPDKLHKSALQTLISAGVVKCEDSIEGLPIKFFHFTPSLNKELNEGVLEQHDEEIMFLHASISDKPMIFEHVLFSDLKINKNTKVLFSGHIHRKMEAVNKDGVSFYNPGSLGRPEISIDYEKNNVSVMLMDYDFDLKTHKTKTINLKYSLPYDVVFDLDKNNKRKLENKNTELFIKAITDVTLSDNTTGNLSDDLLSFANDKKIPIEIVNIAIDTINIVKTGGEL